MPVPVSYPGVYVEEIPSGVRTITGVATSITAFLGRALRGPVNEPTTINSFGDFERIFGGLGAPYPMSYAVRDFYLNGGSQAIIVRLYKTPAENNDGRARLTVAKDLKLAEVSPGSWGKKLRVSIDVDVLDEVRTRMGLDQGDILFNITIRDTRVNGITEQIRNVSVVNSARRVDKVLAAESSLVRWDGTWPSPPSPAPVLSEVKTAHDALKPLLKTLQDAQQADPQVPSDITTAQSAYDTAQKALEPLLDGVATIADKKLTVALNARPRVPADITAVQKGVTDAETAMGGAESAPLDLLTYQGDENLKTGIHALDNADLFNLLCIPPDTIGGDVIDGVYASALRYCAERRAMLIVDAPSTWANAADITANNNQKLTDLSLTGDIARNAALFFPRVVEPDPMRDGQLDTYVSCGIVAGVFAHTDAQRGVWKAPAGIDAALNGVRALSVNLTDKENGMLNPLGINCLRSFPVYGRVVWGARTLRGADQAADEYKYIPVRRTALYIEESLYRGLKWVVFEPNDEPLWAQMRLNVGAFMHNLFRQGAFQGKTPREAYFVKCDKETTTQNDINLGIVNIVVGFAPLKPAEFVIIKLQQMAGQIDV
jgi:hypothetical protein